MNKARGKSIIFRNRTKMEVSANKKKRFDPSASEVREAVSQFLARGGTIEKLSEEHALTADVKVPITETARAGHGGITGDQEGYEIPRESALDVFGFPSL